MPAPANGVEQPAWLDGTDPEELRGRESWRHPMRNRSPRRLGVAASLVVVVALAASIGVAGSVGHFSAAVANTTNTFSTSVLMLGDSQGGEGGACQGSCQTGTALINVSNIEPGTGPTDCILVGWYTNRSVSTVTLSASVLSGATLAADLVIPTAQYNSTPGSSFTIPHAAGSANPGCSSYPGGGTNTSVPSSGGHQPGSSTALSTWADGTVYTASTTNWTWYKFAMQLPSADSVCHTYCGLSTQVRLTWTATST
jgi:hypothetical protein